MLTKEKRKALVALGTSLSPDMLKATMQLFDQEHCELVQKQPATAIDVAYGNHQRHALDIYRPQQLHSDEKVPVLIFVHGGGFLKGDKGSDQHWHNSNVGRCAAQAGYIGIVINYRLAPDHTWPAGGEDVFSAVCWARENAESYGGDANNIFIAGTSAGAVHVATCLQLNPQSECIRGAILLSGLYGYTDLEDRDMQYYDSGEAYSQRAPRHALVTTETPVFIACAELDPPRFQKETLSLLQERLEHHQLFTPSTIVTGHNHYSLAMHLGSRDTRLWKEIKTFIDDTAHA